MLSDHSNVLPVNTFFYFVFFVFFSFFWFCFVFFCCCCCFLVLAFCFIGVLYFPCPHSFKKEKKKEKKQHNPVLAVVMFTCGDNWVLGTDGQ